MKPSRSSYWFLTEYYREAVDGTLSHEDAKTAAHVIQLQTQ